MSTRNQKGGVSKKPAAGGKDVSKFLKAQQATEKEVGEVKHEGDGDAMVDEALDEKLKRREHVESSKKAVEKKREDVLGQILADNANTSSSEDQRKATNGAAENANPAIASPLVPPPQPPNSDSALVGGRIEPAPSAPPAEPPASSVNPAGSIPPFDAPDSSTGPGKPVEETPPPKQTKGISKKSDVVSFIDGEAGDDKTDGNEDSGGDDSDEDKEDKWSPNMSRKAAGLKKYDQLVIGRIPRWKAEKLVVSDGPQNSARYRIKKPRDVPGASLGDKPNLMDDRFGEQKVDRKFIYGKEHFVAIQGVAFETNMEILRTHPQDFPQEVDLVKPKGKAGYPIIKGVEMRLVDSLVKIKWRIGDRFEKTWETRTTVRRLLGKEDGDKAIYDAAKYQEDLYNAWQTGTRPGRSVSATPAPGMPGTAGGSQTSAPPPASAPPITQSSQGDQQPEMRVVMKRWLENYKMMFYDGRSDFTDEERVKIMDAWTSSKEYKTVSAF